MLIAFACLVCLDLLSAQTVPSPLAGDYEGTHGALHLILHLRQGAGAGMTGTIDTIDQDAFGVRCADITESGIYEKHCSEPNGPALSEPKRILASLEMPSAESSMAQELSTST